MRPLPQGRIIDHCRHDLDMDVVLGATPEFLGRKPSVDDVEQALGMYGIWNTARGQVTDDGEMTLALLQALAGQGRCDVSRAAWAYRHWYLGEPFDIGNANALEDGDPDRPNLAEFITRRALMFNSESKANGSLMRATPLGIWSPRVSLEEAVDAARADARLTHPNPSCQWFTAICVVAIRHLMMLNADYHHGAFEAARSILPAGEGDEVHSWLDNAAAAAVSSPGWFCDDRIHPCLSPFSAADAAYAGATGNAGRFQV